MSPQAGSEQEDPLAGRERLLCDAVRSLLGDQPVGPTDDIFELGADSMTVVRLVLILRRQLGAGISVKDVFAAGTPRALARVAAWEALPEGSVAEFAGRFSSGPVAVTPQQRSMLAFLAPRGWPLLYEMVARYSLTGELDSDALLAAIERVVLDHEILHCTYEIGDQGWQHVRRPDLVLGSGLVAVLPKDRGDMLRAEAVQLLDRAACRPFCLTDELPVRFHLIRTRANEYLLQVAIHHVACDGWSLPLLLEAVSMAYAARLNRGGGQSDRRVEDSLIQYLDYARTLTDGEDYRRAREFWRSSLQGAVPVRLSSASRIRGVAGSDLDAAIESRRLPEATWRDVLSAACSAAVTPNALLFSAFSVLLWRRTCQTDLVIAVHAANRSAETQNSIGYFANTLLVRVGVDRSESIRAHASRAHLALAEALTHSEATAEDVAKAVGQPGLYRVLFGWEDQEESVALRLAGVETSDDGAKWIERSRRDLCVYAIREQNGVQLQVLYRKQAFSQQDVRGLLDDYVSELNCLTASLDTPIEELSAQHVCDRSRLAAPLNDDGDVGV
jgi:acyl carrier protein